MQQNDGIVFETLDMFGSTVRFHKRNHQNHLNKHPELRQVQFYPGQVRQALQHPTLTIEGNLPHTLCYYFEILNFRSIVKYAKVVVYEENRNSSTDPHCVIMTAFKIDHIQETKYGLTPTYYNN